MKIRESLDNFPFKTFRTLGVLLVLHGILTLAGGIFDVVWTVINYTDQNDDCDGLDFTSQGLDDPCNNDELTWTWAASGIWGGLLILLAGVVGTRFTPWRTNRLKFQRDMFTVFCTLLVLPVCPAVLAVSTLQLYYQDDIFYRTTDDDTLEVEDYAKLVVPLAVIGLTFLAWCVAIAGSSIGCCCASVEDAGLVAPLYAPQQQVLPMQPTEQYEVVAVPQQAPPPYYVIGPPPPNFYGPPGPRGPLGMPPPFPRPGPY